MSDICFFGETYFRSQSQKFGIRTDDRRRHMYVIGKTGMGKTTLLENMVYSDVVNGHGLCYIDPHGDTAEKILDFIPSHRINDVIYFNPADMDYPISFNVLESVDASYKHLIASGMVAVFKKIWADSWGPRLEYILRNCLLALLDHPDSTLLGVTRMLVDNEFRKKVINNVKDPVVKSFWLYEFTKFNDRTLAEVISPIQNKVGQFLSTALIRNIVGQVKTSINFREIMDNRKILIINLSKGRIGEDSSALLGAMMITKLQLAAMSRVDIPEEKRADFYLYVDEFQNFATESFAGILSEARKYRLNLIVAHQYISQLEEAVADAIFGNVGTIISYRIGGTDAEFLVKEFTPFFNEEDFVNLPKFYIYLKLMINGVSSNPFSAKTLPPLSHHEGNSQKIINVTRERYAKKREIVEDKIMRWSGHSPKENEEKVYRQKSTNNDSQSVPQKDFMKRDEREKLEIFQYSCNECNKNFELSVNLDTAKPIFCKECLAVKRSMQAKKKNDFPIRMVKNEKPQIRIVRDFSDQKVVVQSVQKKNVQEPVLFNKDNKVTFVQKDRPVLRVPQSRDFPKKIKDDIDNKKDVQPGQVISL